MRSINQLLHLFVVARSITCLFTDHMTNNDQRKSYCVDFILPCQRCTIISHGHQPRISGMNCSFLGGPSHFHSTFFATVLSNVERAFVPAWHLCLPATSIFLLADALPQSLFPLRKFAVKPQRDSCHTKGAGAEASSS